ncbi:DUF1353 domain-containing protein [Shewanella surugensis]|uniref:DUF1353 domain-containing protein n=1 Tax=Shewanella surugensis TaxID=212020 RepID=A0ABT0LAU7_9GAMM|nr:DUF1353 domain-containing protein [Shewanella surugensis]MCL1124831.1 DUF1353 domain-containing protein [Shewanella surugensis]
MNKPLFILIIILFLSGCASKHYEETATGKLSGKLTVQWTRPDEFLFVPDEDDPLTFERSNGQLIIPKNMPTDGGSIPRVFWVFNSFSPWGYAPAFIIHDWLFHMKYCRIPSNEKYDVLIAGQIISEVMKTMMNNYPDVEENKFVLYSMNQAVTSDTAKDLWDNGKCPPPEAQKQIRARAFALYGDTGFEDNIKSEDNVDQVKDLQKMKLTIEF